MNKKILTLFLVVAFSAIFAVSCNNKTTDPVKDSNTGTTTASTPTSADPQKKDLGKITASAGTELKKAATIASIATKKTTDETKSVTLTLTLDPKVDDVKYDIKAVKREVNSDDNSNQVNTQLEGKVASFKYDGTKLTLAKDTTLENFEATKT
ncbi:hypothetical protein E6A52_13370, partial [Brachyspira hampsonii]|nr:hypothetical protein [Brachyspira hampsonii]